MSDKTSAYDRQQPIWFAPEVPPEQAWVMFVDGEVIGWVQALTPADALRIAFYDWQNERFKALRAEWCKYDQISDAADCGRIHKPARYTDPELLRLKRENAELKRRLRALQPKRRKARK